MNKQQESGIALKYSSFFLTSQKQTCIFASEIISAFKQYTKGSVGEWLKPPVC